MCPEMRSQAEMSMTITAAASVQQALSAGRKCFGAPYHLIFSTTQAHTTVTRELQKEWGSDWLRYLPGKCQRQDEWRACLLTLHATLPREVNKWHRAPTGTLEVSGTGDDMGNMENVLLGGHLTSWALLACL